MDQNKQSEIRCSVTPNKLTFKNVPTPVWTAHKFYNVVVDFLNVYFALCGHLGLTEQMIKYLPAKKFIDILQIMRNILVKIYTDPHHTVTPKIYIVCKSFPYLEILRDNFFWIFWERSIKFYLIECIQIYGEFDPQIDDKGAYCLASTYECTMLTFDECDWRKDTLNNTLNIPIFARHYISPQYYYVVDLNPYRGNMSECSITKPEFDTILTRYNNIYNINTSRNNTIYTQ